MVRNCSVLCVLGDPGATICPGQRFVLPCGRFVEGVGMTLPTGGEGVAGKP